MKHRNEHKVEMTKGEGIHTMEMLEKRLNLLEAAGHMAKVGGWKLNIETNEVLWTKETCRIHEVSLEYKPAFSDAISFYHLEDRPIIENAVQRALGTGEPFNLELRLITARGNQLWVQVICNPQIIEGGPGELAGTFQDITERRQAEEALRESESRVQRKLSALLEPEGDIDVMELSDIIDCEAFQSLTDSLYRSTGLLMGIVDLNGRILVVSGWQDICVKFHRVHPITCRNCTESDVQLSQGVAPGTCRLYRCKNNMYDMATPIIVGGRHVGNLFFGQFFLEDEAPDREVFRLQARHYGFDEKEYLAALDRVPRLKREAVNTLMTFYAGFAAMIANLSHGNIKLAQILAQKDTLLSSLSETRDELQMFLKSMINAFALFESVFDDDGRFISCRFVYINEAYERITGVKNDEVKGRTIHEVWPGTEPEWIKRYGEVAVTGDSQTFDMYHQPTAKHYHCNVYRPRDTQDRFCVVFEDINDRIRAEEKLSESRRYLQTVIESLPQLVWTCRGDGPCDFLSPQWIAYTGIAAEKQLGFGWLEQLHPDDKEPTISTWNEAVRDNKDFNVEFRIRRHDGVYRWFKTRAVTSRDAAGRITKWFGSNTDIEDMKNIEEAFKKSEARYRMIFEESPVALWEFDLSEIKEYLDSLKASGVEDLETYLTLNQEAIARCLSSVKVMDVNGAAFTMLAAKDRDEMLAHHERIFTEDTIRSFKKGLHILYSGHSSFEDEAIFQTYQGKRMYLFVKLAIPHVYEKNWEKIFMTLVDVSERRKIQEELKRAVTELQRSNRELEQFAYVASHDLQEPLRMVSSYTQLLAQRYEGQLDEKAKKYIDYAVDGAVRMQQLINDLLAYSRIGTQGRQPEPIDARTALSEACRNLQASIEESGAMVTNDDLPTVHADAGQLLQLFQNLIGNSIKFRGADPPRVHVSARDLGREWCFSVKDNGIGMESQYADRVFVIFQRLHTQDEYPGTGIGLAVCKRIVERHGGRIWLESRPGEGSSFFFTIPK